MSYDNSGANRQNKKNNRTEVKSPSQNASSSYSIQESYALNVNIPTKIHYSDSSSMSELYMDSGIRADKLAYTQTDRLVSDKIRASEAYAPLDSSQDMNATSRPQGTNEKVKIDLAA